MFTAILFVTVFVEAAPAVSVIPPPPVPLIAIGMSKKLLLRYAADDIPR